MTQPRTPFAELRPNPFAQRSKPTRFPAIRIVLKAGSIIAGLSTVSAGVMGLVAGGMHGVAFATGLFSAMSALGMIIAVSVALACDSTKAVRDGLAGRTLTTQLVEQGAGQLSVPSGQGRGDLAHPG